jgi:hypothetical protein
MDLPNTRLWHDDPRRARRHGRSAGRDEGTAFGSNKGTDEGRAPACRNSLTSKAPYKAQVAQTARPKVPMCHLGADCSVVVRHRLCRATANETLVSHCRVVGIELRRRVCFFVVLKRGNARGAKGAGHRHLAWVNRQREEPDVQWKAAAFARWHESYDARVSSPVL